MHLSWAVTRGAVEALKLSRSCRLLTPRMGSRPSSSSSGSGSGSGSGSDSNRRFTDKHEWVVKSESGSEATVGISQYAQDALGEVVFVQLPAPGTRLQAGDECGSLESVKAASELYSPVSGTVSAKNDQLEATPALVNSSCYDHGWLFKLHLDDSAEFDKLMDQHRYDDFLKADAH